MQSKIQVFKNTEFGEIRTTQINGEPWFVLKDTCDILGIGSPHKVAERLDSDERGRSSIPTLGGSQSMTVINESGLYAVILRSDKPNARAFRKWITSHVLPTIRKHGGYIADEVLDRLKENPKEAADFFNALKEERDKRKTLERQITVLSPKAFYYDIILQCKDAIPISIIAKDYGMTAIGFNKLLKTAGIQYKIRGTWLLRNAYCNKGYTISRTFYLGDGMSAVHTYWTQTGRRFIYELLRSYDILPEVEYKQEVKR